MAELVRHTHTAGSGLSPEQIAEIREAEKYPIVYDEDCPELTDEQIDYEAVARADDAVRRMQPSSRQAGLAPMYKNNHELAKALLQFQSPLNVIWQQWRYDIVVINA